MDVDFNEFMNLSSIHDIKDKTTIKVIYLAHDTNPSPDHPVEQSLSASETFSASSECSVLSYSLLPSGGDSDDTVTIPTSDAEVQSVLAQIWPQKFPIPRFQYDVEVQLQRGNEIFVETGTSLKISPGLKSGILEKLAENIFQYTAYPRDSQIDDVAKSLVEKFPCLKEKGSVKGYSRWIFSLKHKMANYRTKMRNIGCPEVTVNSMKNKSRNEYFPAKNVKKPRRAEVNFCPANPTGETDENLEKLRCELLVDFGQRKRSSAVKEKMSKTFAYRRRNVIQNSPTIQDFKTFKLWPALFQTEEIGAEFQRITTIPLQNTFMAQLDKYVPQLIFYRRQVMSI
ncbi:uncharacterized protein [Garra rufa]|uniref:uncharacterized protein n=1 Tax=Garra rufa TaxID=137080 RepID=UPI003CCECDB8